MRRADLSGDEITDTVAAASRRWAHVSCPPGLFDLTSEAQPPIPEPVAALLGVDRWCLLRQPRTWWVGLGDPGWPAGIGRVARTTNQRMEIQAVLEAVGALDGPLLVVSDSTYVVNCFRDRWWRGWLARGWLNSAKKPVANQDLWEPLVTEVGSRGNIDFRWVKGHSGDPMNDLVDLLAVAAQTHR